MSDALKPYLARSFGLHLVALAAALLFVPRALIKADKIYMIDFVGGAPAIASSGPSAPVLPTAALAAQNPAPQVDPDSIAPKGRRATALPRPSLLKGWTEPKALPKPSLPAAPAPAAAPTAGMPGDAAGVATDLPNFPYPWYISQVRQMLWAAWRKRMPSATGEGIVVFAIMRNGAYTDLRMESTSGDAEFDGAAIEAVQAAAPFPALPSDFTEPFLKIHLTLKSEASWR